MIVYVLTKYNCYYKVLLTFNFTHCGIIGQVILAFLFIKGGCMEISNSKDNNRSTLSRDLSLILVLSFVLTIASILFIDQVVDLTMIKSLIRTPVILIMNYIPVLISMLIIYFITGRVDISFLIVGIIILVMGVANQNKLFYRHDNVRASDLRLISEAKGMIDEGISIKLHKIYVVYPVFILAITWALRYLKFTINKRTRAIGTVLFLLVGIVSINTVLIDRDTYWNNSMERFHPYIEVERAKDRGMVYTFAYGYRDLIYKAPDNYDPSEVEEFLAQYEESMPNDDKKVDIIAIMGESYADIESMGANVSPEVYEPFRKLQEQSIHGNLQNYAFGGGTIETERNFLVGVYTHGPYIKPRNSFAWMLKDQGYEVEGMHPYTGTFYNRLNTNKYLGIDKFYYSENFFDEYFKDDVEYFPDEILFPIIIDQYEDRDHTKPYFNFVVTMQNHTPYSPEDYGLGYYLDRESFDGTDEDYNSANNYFIGVMDTGNRLLEFTEELEQNDDPVVVIFFGDHLPRLGLEGQLYEMMGVNIELDSEEGWLNNYTTPYIIWANSAAKEVLGDEMVEEGPYMSNYFLFGYALDKLGFKTPYIQYLNDRLQEIPIDATSYTTEDGQLTSSPSQETMEKKWRHNRIQYYHTTNFEYEHLIDEQKKD